jgi:glucose/arabinose dehydrogenase
LAFRAGVGRRAFALIAVALAGCSSAATRTSGAPAPRPAVPSHPATTTATEAPPDAATTIRPAAGFQDTPPPPAIHATGSDYVAIVTSLMRYRDWTAAHHPDPALSAEIMQRGTAIVESDVADLTMLRTKRLTVASVDKHQDFTVVSVHGPLMTFRMRERLVSDQWFDAAHHVVRTDLYPDPHDYVVVMARDATGRWRIADLTPVALDPAIVLSP